MPGESYRARRRGCAATCVSVRKGLKGPAITLSRTHPNLVRKLFALEVPEIADGSVEIVALAREAGHRTKIAVRATVPGVNAKGACIGPMGQRVRAVMSELHGEKIDIVDYSDDPATFVAAALSPAQVESVEVVDLAARAGAGRRPRLPAVAGHRQGGPERPARREAHRVAHRHPSGVTPGAPAGGERTERGEPDAVPPGSLTVDRGAAAGGGRATTPVRPAGRAGV